MWSKSHVRFSFQVSRTLRGHIEEIQDLCWNTDGSLLLSGSIDTSARLWNTATGQCLHAFRESKGLIQGVAIDPLGKFIATFADDKSVRIYHATNKRCAFKNTKFSHNDKLIKLFGDTGDGFFHRICFSPNGEFFMVPSGSYQLSAESSVFCTYVYCRDSLNKPVLYLPCGKRPSVAVAFCPLRFKLRRNVTEGEESSSSVGTVFNLQYRLIFTVITEQSLLFYDTEKLDPFARVENIHYASLNSGSWNNDGTLFVATSSDGYVTICNFEAGELGEVMPDSDVVFQTVQTPQNTPITAPLDPEKEEDMEVQSSVVQEVQDDKLGADSLDDKQEKPKEETVSKQDDSKHPRTDDDDKESDSKKNEDKKMDAEKSEESTKGNDKDVGSNADEDDVEDEIMCIDGPSTPKTNSETKSKCATKLTSYMTSQNAKPTPRMSLGSSYFKKQAEKDKKDKKKENSKDSKKSAEASLKRNQILNSFARGNRILAESLRQQKENAEKNGEELSANKENNGLGSLKPITIDDDSNSTPDVATTPKPMKEKQMETPPRKTSAPTTPKSILKTPSPNSPLVASGKKRRVSFKNVDVSNKEATSGKDEKLDAVQDVEMEELLPAEKAPETTSSEAPSKKRKIPFVTLA